MESYTILVINPGSTTTKIGVFTDTDEVFSETLGHSVHDLRDFRTVTDQLDFRTAAIEETLTEKSISEDRLDAVVGRGGVLRPVESGTFEISGKMIDDLRTCRFGEHASNLGALIAKIIADRTGISSYIVDPVVVDELDDIARLSGHPNFERRSRFHALNQKAVAREAARMLGGKYEELNIIVAHLGGGTSIGLHRKGRVVDVNNALNGEGPFTPERSGTLPAGDLVDYCFSGGHGRDDIMKMIKGEGGLAAYLGTNSTLEVTERIASGDKRAGTVYRAMAYQVAKTIMGLFAGADGKIDGVVLTGGVVKDGTYMVPWIEKMLGGVSRLIVIPGEHEMKALASGALRVLRGEEKPLRYS